MNAMLQPELVGRYREFDARCARESDRLSNKREFEETVFVPTEVSRREAKRRLEGLLREAEDLPAPDPVYLLLRTHFREFLSSKLRDLETMFSRPARFVSGLTGYVDFVSRQDSREPEKRVRLVMGRARLAGDLWRGIETLIPSSGRETLRDLREACVKLRAIALQGKENADAQYQGLCQASHRELDAAFDILVAKSAEWENRVTAMLSSVETCAVNETRADTETCAVNETEAGPKTCTGAHTCAVTKFDPEGYRLILRDELGVDLDDLLKWHDDEVRATRDEVFEIASRINLGAAAHPKDMAGVVEALNRFAGPCESPQAMFARMRSYLDLARSEARKLVRLPEESVRVIPTPHQYRDSYPWGGYGGGCPKRRPLVGDVFLNDGNYRAITDGWIKINAVHECYPGHHAQWVRSVTDPLPETVKIGARGVPLLEGACVRTERLMEHVFPDDPFYPLFVAYRRHHTATRIKADLYLQHFGRPIDDIVDLYVEEMGFDRGTARGQVKAQELMIGYFTCYYYGLKRLRDLQRRYRVDDKDFTEIIFGLPRVSLSTLERFLELSPEDRKRVLTDFPSMIPS